MKTEYTERIYLAEDGCYLRESEVNAWNRSSPDLPADGKSYRCTLVKSPLPLTNVLLAAIVAHWMTVTETQEDEKAPTPWDWEEPD